MWYKSPFGQMQTLLMPHLDYWCHNPAHSEHLSVSYEILLCSAFSLVADSFLCAGTLKMPKHSCHAAMVFWTVTCQKVLLLA